MKAIPNISYCCAECGCLIYGDGKPAFLYHPTIDGQCPNEGKKFKLSQVELEEIPA